jgi:hypothetical protein
MINLNAKNLQIYVADYDYEVNLKQAEQILALLNNYCDYGCGFNSEDIQIATDYVCNGERSRFADYFN